MIRGWMIAVREAPCVSFNCLYTRFLIFDLSDIGHQYFNPILSICLNIW